MDPPKVFISYSWDSEEHKNWVRELAARLTKDGVKVTLDQWHLSPGDQLPVFMERSLRDNDFILMICTPGYKHRADNRIGGVGYEGDIFTGEVLARQNHRKFVPLFRTGTEWIDSSPTWLAGKLYIDFRQYPGVQECYRVLLMTVFGAKQGAHSVSAGKQRRTLDLLRDHPRVPGVPDDLLK